MKIIFNDIKLFAYHGWYVEERSTGHWFTIDVEMQVNKNVNLSDDLSNTFNYEIVYEIVKLEMTSTQKLLETVVQNILQKIMHHEIVKGAKVRVNKLDPYKMNGVGKVGIELSIER